MPRSYLDPPSPIVALATPLGHSALALIRVTGPGSIELAASLFSRPESLRSAPSFALVHGEIVDPAEGGSVDELLVAVFRSPAGPTGEDALEFSCHGSPAVVRRILGLLEDAGFAPALPGEFSFRAFLSGKRDLVECEATAELVAAKTETARAEAMARLVGGLSRRVWACRRSLVELLAEAEARLDHEETDTSSELDPEALRSVRNEVGTLASTYATGRLHAEGARVVVAGRPNAGKSSLFNLALREERAIVSPEPGTTRDWLEEELEIEGIPIRLLDTAGIRETEQRVEAEGVSRSLRLAAQADAVVYLVDGTAGLKRADFDFLESRPDAIRVWNKTDLPGCEAPPRGFLPLSTVTAQGFPELAAAIARAVRARSLNGAGSSGPGPGGPGESAAPAEPEVVVASERQKRLLDRAAAALDEALLGLERGVALDALALDLREAAEALGEMTGEISSAEIIEALFSRFCVGK
jgi:tRNA modification GTPase